MVYQPKGVHVELQLPDELKNLLGAPLYAFSIPTTLSKSTNSTIPNSSFVIHNSLPSSPSCLTLAMLLLALKSGHITIPNSSL